MVEVADLMERNLHQEPCLLEARPLDIGRIGGSDDLLVDILRSRDMSSRRAAG